jgi:hypothetical protein
LRVNLDRDGLEDVVKSAVVENGISSTTTTTHIDFHFSLVALADQDMLQVAPQRRTAKCPLGALQTWSLGFDASEGTVAR